MAVQIYTACEACGSAAPDHGCGAATSAAPASHSVPYACSTRERVVQSAEAVVRLEPLQRQSCRQAARHARRSSPQRDCAGDYGTTGRIFVRHHCFRGEMRFTAGAKVMPRPVLTVTKLRWLPIPSAQGVHAPQLCIL